MLSTSSEKIPRTSRSFSLFQDRRVVLTRDELKGDDNEGTKYSSEDPNESIIVTTSSKPTPE